MFYAKIILMRYKSFLVFVLTFLVVSLSAFADDMRFVQVTDVRYNSANENDLFTKTIKDINKQKDVEFVVFTGDNINKPDKNELEAFINEAKKLKCPFYLIIGDKDVNKHKDLSKKQYIKEIHRHIRKFKSESPNYVFEKNGFVFMVVDGAKDVIPGTNGFYKDDVLSWLNTQLDLYKDKNVIIFQHFPLIPPSSKETYYTFKPENYLKILHNHKNVKAVISGHFGVNSEQHFDGVSHITTAGLPYYRVIDIMDYETTNPTIWAELKEVK